MSNNCDYCDESFSSSQKLLKHYKSTHYGDLSSIDKRRVDNEFGTKDDATDWFPYIAGVVVIIAIGGALYFGLSSSSGGKTTVNTDGSVQPSLGAGHDHVGFSMSIKGQQIDFSKSRWQMTNQYIHFEGGDGSTLHLHASRVTLEYALEALGFGTDTGKLTYGEQTFVDGENAEVKFLINGEPVDPTSHILADGENVQVIVK